MSEEEKEEQEQTLVADESAKEEAPKQEEPKEVKYELKLPENSYLAEDVLEKTVSYAKERGLSNDVAQDIINQRNEAISAYVEGMEAKRTEWLEQSKGDKVIGGDNLNESVELAKRGLEHFATEGFRKALEDSGLGNHRDVIETFMKIGRKLEEDKLVQPGTEAGAKKSLEELFYPNKENK